MQTIDCDCSSIPQCLGRILGVILNFWDWGFGVPFAKAKAFEIHGLGMPTACIKYLLGFLTVTFAANCRGFSRPANKAGQEQSAGEEGCARSVHWVGGCSGALP